VPSAVEFFVAATSARDAADHQIKAVAKRLQSIAGTLQLQPEQLATEVKVIRYPIEDDGRISDRTDEDYWEWLRDMPTADHIRGLLVALSKANADLLRAYEGMSDIERQFLHRG
jgi:hypothetical protein